MRLSIPAPARGVCPRCRDTVEPGMRVDDSERYGSRPAHVGCKEPRPIKAVAVNSPKNLGALCPSCWTEQRGDCI